MAKLPNPAPRIALVLLALAVLAGCASAPRALPEGIATERELQTLRDAPHAQVGRFLDAPAVQAVTRVAPPRFSVAEGAAGAGIDAAKATLVANRAARDICTALAPFYEISEEAPELLLELRVTAVQPTSPAAAGFSELIGVFVPGPFRLPAGLGGFAADGVARRAAQAEGGEVLVLRWAEGANPVTEGARVSRIGDAYQLAGDFADDFSKALIDPLGREGERRPRLQATQIKANEALCLARFGRVNVAGQGASILLPLAPEAIDPGPPVPATAPPQAAESPENGAIVEVGVL